MLRKIFLVFVFVMAGFAYSSDSLTVSGRIVDQKGLGVENAKIFTEENVSTITNLNGDFEIKISKNCLPVDNPDIVPESYKSYKIKIFNLVGQKVFEKEYKNQTVNTFSWNGKNNSGNLLSSGLYFPILEINNKIVSKSKVTIVGDRIINKTPFVKFGDISHTTPNLAKFNSTYSAKFDIIGENFANIIDTVLYISDSDNDDQGEVDNIVLRTFEIDYITDVDGNTYKTVKIGDQWWMAENLKVTKYRNGDAIPNVTDNTEWSNLDNAPAYCVYNNDESNAEAYGYLYNWYAVNDSCHIAPEGWHVPTDEEWKELEMALGMSESAANNAGWRGTNEGSKLAGRADLWDAGVLENNAEFGSSGIAGLPAGYREYSGTFHYVGHSAYFWSATEYNSSTAWFRGLYFNSTKFSRYRYNMRYGFSVRCIKDETAPENKAPEASFTVTPTVGTVDTVFTFDASGSSDAEDDSADLQVRWDFDGDNTWDTDYSTTRIITHQFTSAGTYTVTLEVLDTDGATDTATDTITVEESSVETGTVTDIDGNVYKTVRIGDQWWMAENLKVTSYRNKETISDCWLCNNDDSYEETYGRLYSWYAVNKHVSENDEGYNIAPEGWHVPTDEDWKELEMALGMTESEANNTGWRETNEGSKLAGRADIWKNGALQNDSEFGNSGFVALPGGYRHTSGNCHGIGYYAYFWSATDYGNDTPLYRGLSYSYTLINRTGNNKGYGFSVRCVRD